MNEPRFICLSRDGKMVIIRLDEVVTIAEFKSHEPCGSNLKSIIWMRNHDQVLADDTVEEIVKLIQKSCE